MTVPARTNTTTAAEVPTTKDVRTGYALSKLNGQGFIDAADVLDGASAAFDRWLAAHDAQVWAEGAECAIDHPTWRAASIRAANPYRADAMTRQADAPAADDERCGWCGITPTHDPGDCAVAKAHESQRLADIEQAVADEGRA